MRAGPLIALALAGLAVAALGVQGSGGGAAPAEVAPTARPRPEPPPHGAMTKLERAIAPRRNVIRRTSVTIGHSSDGRPINAIAVNGIPNDGNGRSAGPIVLAIGCIHGDECAGIAAVRRAYFCRRPEGGDLVVVRNLNPDGLTLRTRLNARGVDLNRNFASGWRPIGAPGDPEHSGPAPFSEPESRLARRLIRRLRPDVTIWFHQQAERLVRAWGPSVPAARTYARLAGEPFRRLPWLAGTAPNWQNHRFGGTSSFVVELPASGPLHADRHGQAILGLAGTLMRGRDG